MSNMPSGSTSKMAKALMGEAACLISDATVEIDSKVLKVAKMSKVARCRPDNSIFDLGAPRRFEDAEGGKDVEGGKVLTGQQHL